MRTSLRVLAVLAAATMLACCGRTVQTTSGADWLGAHPAAIQGDSLGDAMRRAASVEPNLRFPARIGLARIGPTNRGPGLTLPSAEEAASWVRALGKLGPDYGEFVPVSPLIAAIVDEDPASASSDAVRRTIDIIRLAAARQHLDAVLIYEVDATADARNTPLSIAEWTLIGAFVLPTQNVKVQAMAQAMLLDVRNGYHYGNAQASADDRGLAPRFAARDTKESLIKRARDEAVDRLADETGSLIQDLKAKLTAPG